MSRPAPPTLRLDGDKVRRIREAKGLTQLYVAEVVGVSVDTVSRWENNRTASVRRENAESLAAALEVDLAEILPDGGEAGPEPPPSPRRRPGVWGALAAGAVVLLTLGWWVWGANGAVRARRDLSPYCPPGSRIPVLIDVETEASRVVVRERLPPGWIFEGSVPAPSQGPTADGVVRWILSVPDGHARIGYVVRAPPGPEGSAHRFEGTVVAGRRSSPRPIRGEGRIDLEYVHWADLDADFAVSDAEVLSALERLDAVEGLGLSAEDLRALWGAPEYDWDPDRRTFVTPEPANR
ncbi:helix-turn-helix domain-containing protein [Deferrisoma sp.]